MTSNSTHLALRDYGNQEQFVALSPYGYIPTFAVCVMFLTLFGLSTLTHAIQSILTRNWFLLGTVVFAGLIECLGWSSRLWSSLNILNGTPFTIQISATIIAPTPFLASNFVIFSRIIMNLGPQYSRLRPRLYKIIFVTSDVFALVLQGVGGGIASTSHRKASLDLGSNIMLGGIGFQLTIMTIFAGLSLEFFLRYKRDIPFRLTTASDSDETASTSSSKSKVIIMSYALCFTTVCLWIRAVYRVLELSQGWKGRIITTQVYFNVLDGGMIILAFAAYNIINPGMFLPPSTATNIKQKSSKSDSEKFMLMQTKHSQDSLQNFSSRSSTAV